MQKSRYYYAVTYPYGRDCSTGEPNEHTGRMSTACVIHAFHTRKERDAFAESKFYSEAVTLKQFRTLRQGSSVRNFEMDVLYAQNTADNLKELQVVAEDKLLLDLGI